VDSVGEQAGVDRAGDGGMVGDLGHDRDAEDFGDIGGPQASGRLVEEDHPVPAACLGGQEGP